jgi:hypothetical protein
MTDNRGGCWWCCHVIDSHGSGLRCGHPVVQAKLGAACIHVAKRQGEPCGPHATLWQARFKTPWPEDSKECTI